MHSVIAYIVDNWWVIPVFLVMISALIAAHELGHYLFARLFGMGVEEFAIGFGRKPIWTYWRKSYLLPLDYADLSQLEAPQQHQHADPSSPVVAMTNFATSLEGEPAKHAASVVVDTPNGKALKETTNFTIRPWPVGGFVRIKGMLPEEDGSETELPGGFYSKAPWQRFVVLLAGPAFSVIAGIILLAILYSVSPMEKANQVPVLGTVFKGLPAAKAGLKEGDRVVSIDGQPISSFYQIISIVRSSPGKHLAFVVQRGGKPLSMTVIPEVDKAPTFVLSPDLEPTNDFQIQGKIGAAWTTMKVQLRPGEAISRALLEPPAVVASLVALLKHPAAIKDEMGGPVTMLAATKAATKSGFGDVVDLAAALSISVGILNLLPFPPLDGGQMVIAFMEMLRRGKRLSIRMQNAVTAAGFMLVMALMAVVMFNDIQRFAGPPDTGLKQVSAPAQAS